MKNIALMLAMVLGLSLALPLMQGKSFAQEDESSTEEAAQPSGGESEGGDGGE